MKVIGVRETGLMETCVREPSTRDTVGKEKRGRRWEPGKRKGRR